MRVMLNFERKELEALVKLAEIERRDTRRQAELIIRRALESAGLLADPTAQTTSARAVEVTHDAQE
jgi:hypothetical protein